MSSLRPIRPSTCSTPRSAYGLRGRPDELQGAPGAGGLQRSAEQDLGGLQASRAPERSRLSRVRRRGLLAARSTPARPVVRQGALRLVEYRLAPADARYS